MSDNSLKGATGSQILSAMEALTRSKGGLVVDEYTAAILGLGIRMHLDKVGKLLIEEADKMGVDSASADLQKLTSHMALMLIQEAIDKHTKGPQSCLEIFTKHVPQLEQLILAAQAKGE